eukprot:3503627-Heterocapsa_arctica.AAC.1
MGGAASWAGRRWPGWEDAPFAKRLSEINWRKAGAAGVTAGSADPEQVWQRLMVCRAQRRGGCNGSS